MIEEERGSSLIELETFLVCESNFYRRFKGFMVILLCRKLIKGRAKSERVDLGLDDF